MRPHQTMPKKNNAVVKLEPVEPLIHALRGERVMLDSDLARIYGVTTGALNRAVKRNRERFPDDFMFQVTFEELADLKCQSGISSSHHGGRRRSRPYAFTEQGVAMLSSVLRSRRAVLVNVEIMRAFVTLRREAGRFEALRKQLAELERSQKLQGEDIQLIFAALRQLEDSTTWAYPEGLGKGQAHNQGHRLET